MKRLIIVSNRLPVNVKTRGGKIEMTSSVGGLATGLGSFYKSYESAWIGWPGISLERVKNRKGVIRKKLKAESCYPVFLSYRDVENYYFGFSNKTIWPLFHYFKQYTVYDKRYWSAYQCVNEYFCEEIVKIAGEEDTIWIQDYHLLLLPRLVREKMPGASIGFFLHIPFPSFEIFRLLPWRKEIIEGMLGADLIGFHTYDYVKYFIDTVSRLLGFENTFHQVLVGNRLIKVDAFPMGIDYERYAGSATDASTKNAVKKIKRKTGARKIILSIDRLDYTKGIEERLTAFELFLDRNVEYRGKVIFILLIVPSRTKVDKYRWLKKHVEELVGKINGRYGTMDWMPIWYLYRSLPFDKVSALYRAADVALITPLRDGMNLVAKEFVASKTDGHGVLILSEMAGAAAELGEALIVNPNNREEIAKALCEALDMPPELQKEHNTIMQRRIQRYNVTRWARDFINALEDVKKAQKEFHATALTEAERKRLVERFFSAKNRLLLLDYDGTLVPFAAKPEEAAPDKDLLRLLRKLASNKANDLVMVSGRDRETLEAWFGSIDISMIAEHGVWLKQRGGDWQTIEPLAVGWKKEIESLMDLYIDRTPGSFLEEKTFSLAWHYRKADPELGALRAKELKDALLQLTSNLNLEVLTGNRVIEVKDARISKGNAVLTWLKRKRWAFILALGDDWTDESVFAILPAAAYSIKVGWGASHARYNISSWENSRELLRRLVSCRKRKK